jgi:hypothetical protein
MRGGEEKKRSRPDSRIDRRQKKGKRPKEGEQIRERERERERATLRRRGEGPVSSSKRTCSAAMDSRPSGMASMTSSTSAEGVRN